jgi:WD40 repeat protein
MNFTDLNIYYGIRIEILHSYFVGHSRSVVALALDEKFMYSGSSDSTLKRWNITAGSFDREYIGHAGSVRTIQTKENLLYSGSMDSTMRVWDKENAKLIDLYDCKCNSKLNLLDPTSIMALYIYNDVIILGSEGMRIVSPSTGEELARQTG